MKNLSEVSVKEVTDSDVSDIEEERYSQSSYKPQEKTTATKERGTKRKLDKTNSESTTDDSLLISSQGGRPKIAKSGTTTFQNLAREVSEKLSSKRSINRTLKDGRAVRSTTSAAPTLENTGKIELYRCKAQPEVTSLTADSGIEIDANIQLLERLKMYTKQLEAQNLELIEAKKNLYLCVDNQKQMIAALESESKNLRDQVDSLDEAQSELQILVQKAQESAFQMLDSAKWMPLDDGALIRQIDQLERRIRTWCKAKVNGSICEWGLDKKSAEDKEKLQSTWSHFVSWNTNKKFPRGFSTKKMQHMGWMILCGWLGYFIATQVFKKPFSFLRYATKDKTKQDGCSPECEKRRRFDIDMHELYSDLLRGHGRRDKDFNFWRSETLRLLAPKCDGDEPSKLKELNKINKIERERHARDLARMFMHEAAPFLREKSSEGLETSVMSLAVDISYNLWTQRSYPVSLMTRYHMESPFAYESGMLGVCSLNLDLEDDLKGREILMVLFPAVYMIGDSEGLDYSVKRVLKRGVIWVR